MVIMIGCSTLENYPEDNEKATLHHDIPYNSSGLYVHVNNISYSMLTSKK